MKSNICELEMGTQDLNHILDEVEKVAKYNELSEKGTLRLRLLAEEMVSMLPNLLEFCEGEFWLENDGNDYELHAKVHSSKFDLYMSEKLLAVSKSGKNEAYKGVMGKIRAAAELMFGKQGTNTVVAIPYDASMSHFFEVGMYMDQAYTNAWSLKNYKEGVEADKGHCEAKEAWDELEKSVIGKLADDVIVGILGDKVDIVIKKTFKKAGKRG